MEKIVGEVLLTKDGEKPTSEVLAGKTAVGIYFSAHWCPPCKGFTPVLAKAYTDHLKAKGLEIIFASSDRDAEQFNEYYGEMPWVALPYSHSVTKNKLSKKFKVGGIPTFVVLDGATGELITKDGRAKIAEDAEGKHFPWKPPTLWEALGDEFLSGTEGDTVELSDLRSGDTKVIGLYFSAHWCPPCKGFTPVLAKAYTDHLKAKGLEIIFVSSDRDQESFMEYYKEMPWLAIPQGDERKGKLSSLFEVQGIPTFVLIDAKTGATINRDGRSAVMRDPEGAEFPYHPRPMETLEDGCEGLNETTALILMLEGCDDATKASAVATLESIATKARETASEDDEMLFLYASKDSGPAEQVRKLAGLGDKSAKPQMLLLDIPDNGGYYLNENSDVSTAELESFLKAYKCGSLDREQLGG